MWRCKQQQLTADNRSVHAAQCFALLAPQVIHKYRQVKGGDTLRSPGGEFRAS